MEYSILELYKMFGQYDNVINITLKPDSVSAKKYKPDLTGELYFPKLERNKLQTQLENSEPDTDHGTIRIRIRSNELNFKQKDELLYDGFDSRDIQSVFTIPFSTSNDYVEKSVRQLPVKMTIQFDASHFDEPRSMLYLYKQMQTLGSLTRFEEFETIAYEIILNHYEMPPAIDLNAYLDPETGLISENVRYKVLEYKFTHATLTQEEDTEFKEIISRKTSQSVTALFEELKAGNHGKLPDGLNKDLVNYLTALVVQFKPQRLSYTIVPVWWDMERYLHIYLRHVSEIQVGAFFKTKGVFQYKIAEIYDLIKLVLDHLSAEINEHFKTNPGKDFNRQGKMSHYYNGDYYTIRIQSDGLLMSFYKNS